MRRLHGRPSLPPPVQLRHGVRSRGGEANLLPEELQRVLDGELRPLLEHRFGLVRLGGQREVHRVEDLGERVAHAVDHVAERGRQKEGVPVGPEQVALVVGQLGGQLGAADDAEELRLLGVGGLGVGRVELASGGLLQLGGVRKGWEGNEALERAETNNGGRERG